MAETSIEWTDATWNPIVGCTVISPGCTNCYAMRMAARLELMGTDKYAGVTRRSGDRAVWTGKLKFDRRSLAAPLGWKRPRMVFVNSMSDLFHERISFGLVRQVWNVMAEADWHTYQILTKRPERMAALCAGLPRLPNVWLGTSVENADYVSRIEQLRQVNAAVRFVSFEPLIGSIGAPDLTGIEWAIVGGESGPRARPMEREWVVEVRMACRESRTAFFFKQWGGKRKIKTGRELDGQTWDEFPAQRQQVAVS